MIQYECTRCGKNLTLCECDWERRNLITAQGYPDRQREIIKDMEARGWTFDGAIGFSKTSIYSHKRG